MEYFSTVFSTEKKNGSESKAYRIVLESFAIFRNVAHSLEPSEKPGHSASHKALNYVQCSYIKQNMVEITT